MDKQGPLDLWSLARARTGSNVAKRKKYIWNSQEISFFIFDIFLCLYKYYLYLCIT